MYFKNDEKIFILKEFARLLNEGENLNALDLLSVLNQTIYSILYFIDNHYSKFNKEELNVLIPFLEKNVSLTGKNKKVPELKREDLTITYMEMNLETGEIILETTKEDAKYIFDELTKNNIKTTTELMYIALKRYAKKEESLFPFKEHIESIFYEKNKNI